MKAEIIAVGTELLIGQIVNTNAQYLSKQLAELGINIYFQTVVGDNAERLKEALQIANARADLVICTGGLGPTRDDITKDVLAEYCGKPLVYHQPSLDQMKAYFQARGMEMVESNLRQALILEGCHPFPNDAGLAVGIAIPYNKVQYVLLPGPPREMKVMFETYVIPWLQGSSSDSTKLFSRILKFTGIGESSLEHAIIDLIEQQSDPTIAPYAKESEVMLRITTRATDVSGASAKWRPIINEIMKRLGDYLYADEDIELEHAVVRRLIENGQSVSVAESCTGGLVSHMLTNVPGSSQVLKGSVVCYTNQVKNRLLQVPMKQLEEEGAPGAISAETALHLAEQVRELMNTEFGLSVTGAAGPAASEGKEPGLVYARRTRDRKPSKEASVERKPGID